MKENNFNNFKYNLLFFRAQLCAARKRMLFLRVVWVVSNRQA